MCGICGKLNLSLDMSIDPHSIDEMSGSMLHRGPDEGSSYVRGPIGLGHRRLKIIDLTTGQQPMSNEDGTVWIVFNGEIYNYRELREQLLAAGHQFSTHSDTEVIVHLYEEHGEQCLAKLRGMFSFAIWDGRNRRLLLARDRVGIKPMYYCIRNGTLGFASEIKALFAGRCATAEVDPAMLDRFLTYFYVPGEQTPFKGVYKLAPGHYMVAEKGKTRIEQYWDLDFPEAVSEDISVDQRVNDLTDLLRETVRGHMISDVPLGVLLSGGVDSTAMLSFATEVATQPISSFTIGFDGSNCVDERPFARLAAAKYGSRHFETTISANEFLSFLPKYVWHMEEPVCEPPAVALYYVSKLAREHVTVLLSGEGGDEVFAGYQNYRNLRWLETIKRGLGPLRYPVSKVLSGIGSIARAKRLQHYSALMEMKIEEYYLSRTADPCNYFNGSKSQLYSDAFRAAVRGSSPTEPTQELWRNCKTQNDLNRMLYVDTKTWLPDDLLIKADKITMANSLELRVPLLDHRVLEFGAALPASLKVHGITTKYLLKKALESRVPAEILNRPKTGFPVPYAQWLQHDLKKTVREVLLDDSTVRRGYFNRASVETLVRRNEASGSYSKEIFSLLTLELWHRMFIDNQASIPQATAETAAPGARG